MYKELVRALRLNVEYRQADNALENASRAADAIEDLEEKAQAYAETLYAYEHPWIPVTERLPNEKVAVLTWGEEQAVVLIDWLHNGEWAVRDGVTHWMPLPQPPKQLVTDSNQVQEEEEK